MPRMRSHPLPKTSLAPTVPPPPDTPPTRTPHTAGHPPSNRHPSPLPPSLMSAPAAARHLAGRVALVTGSAQGIGGGILRALAGAGAGE